MSNNATANANANDVKQAEKKKKLRVTLEQPLQFVSTLDSNLTSTLRLGELVNALFRDIFPDYEGCVILPANNGGLMTSLYFRANKGGNNVIPIGSQVSKSSSMNDRMNSMRARMSSSNRFDLSDEVKEAIAGFIHKKPDADVNWKQIMSEQVEQSGLTQNVYLRIDNIDINRILKTIYNDGANREDDKYIYNVLVNRAINSNNCFGYNQNYLITIQKLNNDEVNNLAHEVGIIPTVGNIPMIRN